MENLDGRVFCQMNGRDNPPVLFSNPFGCDKLMRVRCIQLPIFKDTEET
jgi:hypothetical protein